MLVPQVNALTVKWLTVEKLLWRLRLGSRKYFSCERTVNTYFTTISELRIQHNDHSLQAEHRRDTNRLSKLLRGHTVGAALMPHVLQEISPVNSNHSCGCTVLEISFPPQGMVSLFTHGIALGSQAVFLVFCGLAVNPKTRN